MTSKQFKSARHALGLTQEELGKALGINPRTVRRYESRKPVAVPRVVELAMGMLQVEKNRTIGM